MKVNDSEMSEKSRDTPPFFRILDMLDDGIITRLDRGCVESEKVRSVLRKHCRYGQQ